LIGRSFNHVLGIYATHYSTRLAPWVSTCTIWGFIVKTVVCLRIGDEHRHTLGAREFAARNHWDWEAEQMLQVAALATIDPRVERGDKRRLYLGHDVESEARLKAGATSGDNNPMMGRLGTFDALFFNPAISMMPADPAAPKIH